PDEGAIGGSYLCDDYELRITQRCLRDDLGMPPNATFGDALAHPVVQAFRNQRRQSPVGTKTIGPAAAANTIYRLGHTDDHRGATWHDEANRVVWLCAYRRHRSGEPADA